MSQGQDDEPLLWLPFWFLADNGFADLLEDARKQPSWMSGGRSYVPGWSYSRAQPCLHPGRWDAAEALWRLSGVPNVLTLKDIEAVVQHLQANSVKNPVFISDQAALDLLLGRKP